MSVSDFPPGAGRPAKLYFYGERQALERALRTGEFYLRPTHHGERAHAVADSAHILPFFLHQQSLPGGFLILSLSQAFNDKLFHPALGVDGCIIIHNTEEFGERLHRAARKALPQWAGIDAAVSYGDPSPLGAAFTKARQLSAQKEWLFAWRPIQAALSLHPVVIKMGAIDAFAELRMQHGPGPT